MDPFTNAPTWLFRPLPANAVEDRAVEASIDQLAPGLPDTLERILGTLNAVKPFREYDSAANRACAYVWRMMEKCLASGSPAIRRNLLSFAEQHMSPEAQARIFRRLAKDPSLIVRTQVRKQIVRANLGEVALPRGPDQPWDPTGWFKGTGSEGGVTRHPQGRRAQQRHGVPPIATLAQLRELLGIRSERQLGYFLLASDAENGPYTCFTIPKRDGSERLVSAPKRQLKWVQRQILEKIVSSVSAHQAAHGFILGRSTVTNAVKHQGAAILVKFDLTDFFPTIHFYRVLGLFASLGYFVGNTRFQTADDAKQVAPTLARLCCYTSDSRAWGTAVLPQGAPTSPAISNLVCRRLDARLDGLAKRSGGVYTRYADDLTFSFKEDPPDLGRFRWWVDQVCHQEGFFVNQAKFRVIRASQRQVVTGIVVNDALRVPREARRRFRAILHNCRRHGLESQARAHPRFAEYLRGFASYVHMVHPEEGAELLGQVEALLGPETCGQEGEP